MQIHVQGEMVKDGGVSICSPTLWSYVHLAHTSGGFFVMKKGLNSKIKSVIFCGPNVLYFLVVEKC